MSKDNYSGMVALLEYMDRKNTKPSKGSSRKSPKMKDFDPIQYVQKRKEEVERWEKFLKDQDKLNKKEDKKPEYKGPSLKFVEWYIIGLLSYPVVGHLWQLAATVK